MAIIKSKHSSNFTVIPNEVFKAELSLDAIGLLAYLLSLPHDWIIYKTNLHNQLKVGRDKLDRCFKELQGEGYIISVKNFKSDGTIEWEHIVYDYPYNGNPPTEKPYTEKPSMVKPSMVKPSTDNQQLLNKEYKIKNTKEINTKETIQNYLLDFEILDDLSFDLFWDLYDKKTGKENAIKLYNKLSREDKEKIFNHIPLYKEARPDKQYRKDPQTYLRNKTWNDEIIAPGEKNNPKNFYNNLIDLKYEYESDQSNSKKFGEV